MIFNFTDGHYEFLLKELGATKEKLKGMNETQLDDFYEKVLDIELAETPDSGIEMSQRGKVAVEIVNIMAEALGYVKDE